MEKTTNSNTRQLDAAARNLHGRHFYPASVIALYCALSVPLGLGLYGINVARRGGRFLGYLLAGLSGLVLLALAVSAAVGEGRSGSFVFPSGSFVFPVVLGIGLYRTEQRPYQAALNRGGLTAKWWPPLIWVLGLWIVVAIMVTLVRTNP